MTAQATKTARVIDRALALRIRQRRVMQGLTQHQMAERIGVTYQQAHKYEQGVNRISVSRLFDIAEVLSVHPAELLTGLEYEAGELRDMPAHRRLLQLAAAFAQLSAREQSAVLGMVRLMARAAPSSRGGPGRGVDDGATAGRLNRPAPRARAERGRAGPVQSTPAPAPRHRPPED
jgi:transcriptional regulator with XRE-family HTH domain